MCAVFSYTIVDVAFGTNLVECCVTDRDDFSVAGLNVLEILAGSVGKAGEEVILDATVRLLVGPATGGRLADCVAVITLGDAGGISTAKRYDSIEGVGHPKVVAKILARRVVHAGRKV